MLKPTLLALFASLALASLAQAQDVVAGEKIFKRCAACHKIGDDTKHGIGPNLNNVIGRQAGSAEEFTKYGKDLVALGETGLVWNEELISEWITDPKKFLRARSENKRAKSKMKLKLKDEQARLDVIAYVAQFSQTVTEMEPEKEAETKMASMVANTGMNQLCVSNVSNEEHFFAVETGGSDRITGAVPAGSVLCSVAMQQVQGGTVSVFESAESLEGCSRLVTAEMVGTGYVEELRKYADFDRCLWSSNAS